MMLLMCDTRPSRLPELEFKDYSCDVTDSHMNTWLFTDTMFNDNESRCVSIFDLM